MQIYSARDKTHRMMCTDCSEISYQNPKVLVMVFVEWGGRILLCRRAEPPQIGYWMLPGGFMECGESLQEAAARETLEETGVTIDPDQLQLWTVSSLTDLNQVYVGFRANLAEHQMPKPGPECLDVDFFRHNQVPWQDLAFNEVASYLNRFFDEAARDQYSIHFEYLNAGSFAGCSYPIMHDKQQVFMTCSRA